jgi:hypothetical protein
VVPVAMLVIVTLAAGSTAPDELTTVPCMSPVALWAVVVEVDRNERTARTAPIRTIGVLADSIVPPTIRNAAKAFRQTQERR